MVELRLALLWLCASCSFAYNWFASSILSETTSRWLPPAGRRLGRKVMPSGTLADAGDCAAGSNTPVPAPFAKPKWGTSLRKGTGSSSSSSCSSIVSELLDPIEAFRKREISEEELGKEPIAGEESSDSSRSSWLRVNGFDGRRVPIGLGEVGLMPLIVVVVETASVSCQCTYLAARFASQALAQVYQTRYNGSLAWPVRPRFIFLCFSPTVIFQPAATARWTMSLAKEETPVLRGSIYPPASLSASSLPALAVVFQSWCEVHCRETLQGYIWQREALKVTVNTVSDVPDHLSISMRHGGSVEDEWLVVHLLLLATAAPCFSEAALLTMLEGRQEKDVPDNAGLLAEVRDEDGQFVLIEGADQLPQWVQPDNAEGRLWFYKGDIHLISPEVHLGDVTTTVKEAQLDASTIKPLRASTAAALIRSSDISTKASAAFQSAIIEQRLPSYPELSWALYAQHSTLAYLPAKAARVLHQYPQLIADAAEAFDGREGPNDARVLREMKVFGPGEHGEGNASNVLLVKVKLPRRLYATLLTQRYFPPRAFGDEWRRLVSVYWDTLEKASRGDESGVGEEERTTARRRDLGCKITCGLELAHANVKERLRSRQRDMFATEGEASMRSDPSYAPFIAALTNIGYFGTNIQDSREWKRKESEALVLWQQLQSSPSKREDEHTSDDLHHLIDSVGKDERGASQPPDILANLSAQALAREEDPDGFLYDRPEQVKAATGAGGPDETSDTEEEKVAMSQVNAFANKLQSFVDGKGDESGALFEDEEMGDESSDGGSGDAEATRFENLSSEERAKAMSNLVPALDEREWGAKRAGEEQVMAVDGEIENDNALKRREEEAPSVAPATTTGFSRRVQYDGASDSEESVDDEVLRAGDTNEDRMNRAKWLGMEQELEEDEAMRRKAREDGDLMEEGMEGEGEGDGEDLQLGQEDLMNFIEFTRKELGLSEEQYENILQERRERGAYVPEKNKSAFPTSRSKKVAFEDPSDVGHDRAHGEENLGSRRPAEMREEKARALHNQRTTAEEKDMARQRAQQVVEAAEAESGQRGEVGAIAEEDSFTRLMSAMDAELLKHSKSRGEARDGLHNATTVDEEMDEGDGGEDEMSAEDAELLERILHSGPPASLRVLMEKEQSGGEGLSSVEQQVMESMLASYQAQLGGAGPVGALAGRLGVGRLPGNTDG